MKGRLAVQGPYVVEGVVERGGTQRLHELHEICLDTDDFCLCLGVVSAQVWFHEVDALLRDLHDHDTSHSRPFGESCRSVADAYPPDEYGPAAYGLVGRPVELELLDRPVPHPATAALGQLMPAGLVIEDHR